MDIGLAEQGRVKNELSELREQHRKVLRELYALPSDDDDNAMKRDELMERSADLLEQIGKVEETIEHLRIRQAVTIAHRADRIDTIFRHSVLVLGCVSFIGMAYAFKSSALAAIPLLGLVVLVVLWPMFEKFRLLSR